MSTSKLDLVNRVLDSVGEKRLTSIGTDARASIVEDCIQLALDEVATSANWAELRKFETPDSWSTDVATIDSTNEVYSVQGVYWYSSSDGDAETNYDYARYPIPFVTYEEFVRKQQWNYDNDSQQVPQMWTYVTDQKIKLSPYPTDATEQGKILVEYYYIPSVPTNDGDNYAPPDRWMRLVEMKASSLLAVKLVNDANLSRVYALEYMQLKRNLTRRDLGLPSGGYSMYAGARTRNISRW